MSVRTTRWRGEPAYAIWSGRVEAVVVPRRGAKIASLRTGGREWLLQPRPPLPPPARPGSSFVKAEMCGWDEMVPTVDACQLPDGTRLPDHGEAWTADWKVARDGDTLLAEARGTVLPWRLRRRISVDGEDLLVDYELGVTGSEPVPLMWTAHPQFAVGSDTLVHLPPSVTTLVDVYGTHRGRVSAWPAQAVKPVA